MNGPAICEKSLTNVLRYPVAFTNARISEVVLGIGLSLITETLLGSAVIPLLEIEKPRKFPCDTKSCHFDVLNINLYLTNLVRTNISRVWSSSIESPHIATSSSKPAENGRSSLSTSFIND